MDNNETILMNTQYVYEFLDELNLRTNIICDEFEDQILTYENLLEMGAVEGGITYQISRMSKEMRELENDIKSYLSRTFQKIDEIIAQRIASDRRASEILQDIASQTDAYKGSGA